MFAWFTSPEAWIALGTLTALEIVLGIDNIIFISILVRRLPAQKRNLARNLGLNAGHADPPGAFIFHCLGGQSDPTLVFHFRAGNFRTRYHI